MSKKPKFGIIYILAFHPSLAVIPILLDMGRSLSIAFLAGMHVITHLLPRDSGGCQEETGSSESHAALSARSVRQNVSGTVGGEISEALSGPRPSKESSPVAKADWEWPKNGQKTQPCLMSIHRLDNVNQDTAALDGKSTWKYF